MPIKFTDPFDAKLAKMGPPALFTQTHEGDLQLDLFRTRDWRRRFLSEDEQEVETSFCHCVCIDTATQWPLYVLVTSESMVASDDRTKTIQCASMDDALSKVSQLKSVLYALDGQKPI